MGKRLRSEELFKPSYSILATRSWKIESNYRLLLKISWRH